MNTLFTEKTINRIVAVITAFVCGLIGLLVFPKTTASADVYDATYDCNSDGVINMDDVELLYQEITNHESSYCIADMISAFRIAYANAAASKVIVSSSRNISSERKIFIVSDFEISEGNNWFHTNMLLSDFDRVVYEDADYVIFDFYDDGIVYYTVLWDKDAVVYNEALDSNECLVSNEYNNVNYQVFIRENRYMLNVCKCMIGSALAMVDYTKGIPTAEANYDFLSSEYLLTDVETCADYVEFRFSLKSGLADYYVRIPFSENNTSAEELATFSFEGSNYTIYSENNGDTNFVTVKVC